MGGFVLPQPFCPTHHLGINMPRKRLNNHLFYSFFLISMRIDILSSLYQRSLDIIESVLDENFWTAIFGDRLIGILKRYSHNDTVLFFIYLTLLPAVAGLMGGIVKWLIRAYNELYYVSIVINEQELIYKPVEEYITKYYRGIPGFRHVRGKTGYHEPQTEEKKPWWASMRNPNDSLQNQPIIDLIPGT